MIVIKTNRLSIGGIALFPLIFINSKLSLERQKVLLNHERIHIRQQLEMLVIPFYIFYLINYLLNRFKYKGHDLAYRQIIFEREAFQNEKDLMYLSKRKFWEFLRF